MKNYETAFREAYLKQLNVSYSQNNWEVFGAEGELTLLHENENVWVLLNKVSQPMFEMDFLNIVNKQTGKLETIEL